MSGRASAWAAHATGFFILSLVPSSALMMALWGVALGASPVVIGLLVGIRSLLPIFLSIHGGALVDRLGVRPVLIVCAAVGVVSAPLYPLFMSVWVGMVLQLAAGLAQAVGWIGIQAHVAGLADRPEREAGRFSFASALGTGVGPIVFGTVWQWFGATPTFLFFALWNACLLAVVLLLPTGDGGTRGRPEGNRFAHLLPRLSDYVAAAGLLATPAVFFVVAMTFLRLAVFGIQASFYTVFLEAANYPSRTIGLLIGLSSLIGGPAALLAEKMSRWLAPPLLLLLLTATALLAISATPLLSGLPSLLIAACVFGLGTGSTLPLLLRVLSSGVEAGRKGLSFGLRGTANRLSSLVVPVAMGAAADGFGLSASFYVTGGVLLAAMAVVLPMAARLSRHEA